MFTFNKILGLKIGESPLLNQKNKIKTFKV